MAQSIKRQRHIRKIITAALGPALGGEIYSTLIRWERSCGPEWTVNRLKALRTAALQSRGGKFQLAEQILSDSGIAYKCHQGIPIAKGPWGQVMLSHHNAQKPSVLRRYAALFRVYTCVYLDSVSEAQLHKAKTAIGDGPKGQYISWKDDTAEIMKMRRNLNLFPNTLRMAPPDLGRLKANSSYYRTMRSGSDPWCKAVGSLLSSVYIPDSLKDYNPCEEFRKALESAGADKQHPGRISFIQEGGAKGRVVATPNVWCQWLFEPLHKALDTLIKGLPQSAVHNQTKGGWFLSQHMGSPMWCFDLSSATDRFPREMQKQILGWLGLEHFGNALEEISTAEWKMLDETISYGVGQPMGLYGSFPLFHLAHYTVLEMAWIMAGQPGTSRPFMVLGDDVVITNCAVARYYAAAMQLLGVELSPTKTIASCNVGEFAGFLGYQTNRGSAVFRPYKYKANGIKNPLSLLHSLGVNVRYLGPYWAKMFDIFAQTLKCRDLDLSPLISDSEETEKFPPTLDSHLLGSLVMRLSYDVPYPMPESLFGMWRETRYTLLGNKEVLNSEGFAPKNLNPIGIRIPSIEDERYQPLSLRIAADPLMRALRYAK